MTVSPSLSSTGDIALMLERFFGLTPGLAPYEWDDFENQPLEDMKLEAWRQRILNEIGHLVAPNVRGSEQVAQDRVSRIIVSLKNDEDA